MGVMVQLHHVVQSEQKKNCLKLCQTLISVCLFIQQGGNNLIRNKMCWNLEGLVTTVWGRFTQSGSL